jgi:hypothetical protein
MASEQNQLPADDSIQDCERRGGECRDHATEVTGRWGGEDDTLDCPNPELVLDSTKGCKTGVDSE